MRVSMGKAGGRAMKVILKGDRDSFSSVEFIVEAYKRLLIRKTIILLAF